MASAFRDPKSLPEWIELDYYRRARPMRRRRRLLGWSFLFLTAGVLGAIWWWGNRQIYQGGPVADPHRLFGNDCASCHTLAFETAKRLLPTNMTCRTVSDQACQKCHEGAVHQAEQKAAPGAQHCADCHKEHQGNLALAQVSDGHCLVCHKGLQRKDDKESKFANVASFAEHPEFWWFHEKTKRADPGAIKFNHAVHLANQGVYEPAEEQLKLLWDGKASGQVRTRKFLNCQDCHTLDAQGWYMQPVRYEQHCKNCHALPIRIVGDLTEEVARNAARTFDREPVSHPTRPDETAATVRAQLRDRFAEFIRENPAVLSQGRVKQSRPFPGWEGNLASTKEEHDWVNRQVTSAWRALVQSKGGCEYCHVVKEAGRPDEIPKFAASNINRREYPRPPAVSERWLPHGLFRHLSHRMVDCAECHDASNSKSTSDVLLPGINTCKKCHNPSAGARSGCVECHKYHDRAKEHAFTGKRTIDECLGAK